MTELGMLFCRSCREPCLYIEEGFLNEDQLETKQRERVLEERLHIQRDQYQSFVSCRKCGQKLGSLYQENNSIKVLFTRSRVLL